jgi:hypothetical protein
MDKSQFEISETENIFEVKNYRNIVNNFFRYYPNLLITASD